MDIQFTQNLIDLKLEKERKIYQINLVEFLIILNYIRGQKQLASGSIVVR